MATPRTRQAAPARTTPGPRRATLVRDGRPLYRQLADDLRARILREEFSVGGSIPTEAALSRDYRASRITVRHALAMLEREGLLHREQGRGSFIRPRAIAVGPRRLTSFSQELRERGQRHDSDLLAVDEVEPPVDIPLDIAAGSRVVRVERLRKADGQALAHQVTFLPAELGPGIAEALREDGSLYAFLRANHAIDIDSADETYRVGAASDPSAALLVVPEGTPVFIVERVGFWGTQRIEWTLSTVVGDGYEVHVHLRR